MVYIIITHIQRIDNHIMNIHKLKRKLKRNGRRLVKRINKSFRKRHRKKYIDYDLSDSTYNNRKFDLHHLREKYGYNRLFFAVYILLVSTICILASQATPNSRFRQWYYTLTHKETINKGVEKEIAAKDISSGVGSFLSMYRYRRIGETNPEQIDPNAPMVAFTFDDGPSSKATMRILEALSANYSHATFFTVGRQTEQFPDLLQAILANGCEIGNHTADHKNLTELSDGDITQQIGKVDDSVEKATGERTTVIRPPYGAYDDNVLALLDKPVILWDVDSEDWKSRNAQTVCDKVLAEAKDGDIILMHDIYESTAEAVELLLPQLKERGFQVVSVSEMAQYKGKTLELGKAYGKIQP